MDHQGVVKLQDSRLLQLHDPDCSRDRLRVLKGNLLAPTPHLPCLIDCPGSSLRPCTMGEANMTGLPAAIELLG
jgi:hypothetical protein